MTASNTKRIVAIGECMVEFTRNPDDSFRLAFAGDTANTAVYLKRAGGASLDVHYLTATGDDFLSERLLGFFASEGLVADMQRVAGASPALYLVSTDASGERSFTYYRDSSPVKQLFATGVDDALAALVTGADLVYFSAITLQMLTPEARERLFDLARTARANGAIVAFDSNYRPRGWASAADARAAVAAAAAVSTLALPSLGDEQLLADNDSLTADDVIAFYRAAGVAEIVVKDGAGPVVVWSDGAAETFTSTPDPNPRDTTGAGDSFNGGYLAARASGASIAEAVAAAQALAAEVIRHPGAIIAR
ncbi:MAG TPA: sugar kinase [Candidatus Lumbricidophila sp.]|nr:sugar kinase [Candidatus Lumbricidophila sp.]